MKTTIMKTKNEGHGSSPKTIDQPTTNIHEMEAAWETFMKDFQESESGQAVLMTPPCTDFSALPDNLNQVA